MQHTPNHQNLFSPAQRRFVQTAFLLVQGASLSICLMTRLMVYGFSAPSTDDLLVLVQSAALSALLVLLPSLFVALAMRVRHRAGFLHFPFAGLCRMLVVGAVCICCLSACDTKGASVRISLGEQTIDTGMLQTASTGLKTAYKNMKPDAVRLTMNGEDLNHTDIPLGERFIIRNEDVRGLTQKDGKVSVGCSLRITGPDGEVVLDEKDVFAGNDVYNAEESCVLKCIVSTGNPMQYDKTYQVKTRFWDKYGNGSITNELTINAIDLP